MAGNFASPQIRTEIVRFDGQFLSQVRLDAGLLGLLPGSMVYAEEMVVEFVATEETEVSVCLVNYAVHETLRRCVRSDPVLTVPPIKSKLTFRNPNPRHFYIVSDNPSWMVGRLHSSNPNALVTYTGLLWVSVALQQIAPVQYAAYDYHAS